MKNYINKYYRDFPIHFESYELENNDYIFEFYNIESKRIQEIVIQFNKETHKFQVNTDDTKIICNIDADKVKNTAYKPSLKSCTVDDKVYLIDDVEDVYNMSVPESVFSLGHERFLYINRMSKAIGLQRKEIEYIAKDNKYFWTCTCGHHNLNIYQECQNCGNIKEKLFAVNIPVDQEIITKKHNINLYKSSAIWLFIVYLCQLFYQGLYGTYLFENLLINDFFHVFNRLIVPFAILLTNAGLILSIIYYRETLRTILKIVFYTLIAFIAITNMINFIGTAYNLLFLIPVYATLLGILYYNLKNKRFHLFNYFMAVFLVFGSAFTVYQWQRYQDYRVTVIDNGLRLYVNENVDVDYIVPDKIDNLDILEVVFDNTYDYQIENLTIGKNIERFYIYSAMVLPYLENIYLAEGNENFYIEDNILFDVDGVIDFVPISITSLYLNSEIIPSELFRDLYNLVDLEIGPNVTVIDNEAFANAYSLETLTFSDNSSISYIGSRAFYNCQSLEVLDLPISLQALGMGAFENCNNLISLTTPFIGEERETTDDLRTSTDILVYLFGSRTYLHSEYIPNSLEYVNIYDIDRIHNVTFYNASHIETIILPDTMTTMGARSFYGCESLETFTIPNGVTIINKSAFENSGITEITIPASVRYIDENAFNNTNITTVNYLGDVSVLIVSPIGNQDFINALD